MNKAPETQFRRTIARVLLPLSVGVLLAGCASTPTQSDPVKAQSDPVKAQSDPMKAAMLPPEKWKYKTADAILKENDVKNKPPEVFSKPIEEVRVAALRALSFVGCKINHREDFYIAGRRPNKFGLFVGSGGETVKVFLYPASTNMTHTWVDTDLSFIGMAGQQGWDKQVKEEMRNILDKAAAAK
jgi:hypothetical protein